MDRKVKNLLTLYGIAAVCCTLVWCGAILCDSYASSLLASYDLFETIKVKKVKIKDAIKDIDHAITQIRAAIPHGTGQESAEADVLLALDILKSRLKSCAITIGTLENKDINLTLPVSIRGVVTDYHKFMSDLDYLQSLKFPFFVIGSLSIDKLEREQKDFVMFEIKGALTINTNLPELNSGS